MSSNTDAAHLCSDVIEIIAEYLGVCDIIRLIKQISKEDGKTGGQFVDTLCKQIKGKLVIGHNNRVAQDPGGAEYSDEDDMISGDVHWYAFHAVMFKISNTYYVYKMANARAICRVLYEVYTGWQFKYITTAVDGRVFRSEHLPLHRSRPVGLDRVCRIVTNEPEDYTFRDLLRVNADVDVDEVSVGQQTIYYGQHKLILPNIVTIERPLVTLYSREN